MKLMMVTPYFYPKMGGMEKYVYKISSKLSKKYDITPIVLCSNWDDNLYKEDYIDGIKIYRLPYLFKISSTPVNPFWSEKFRSIIDKEKPDIVNGHIPVPYIADTAARIAHKKTVPFILTYHNDLTGYNPVVRLLSKAYYHILGLKTFDLSQRIIVTSEYYAQTSPYLKKYYQKLRVASPGVDIEKYNINPANYLKDKYNLKDEKIVLFVGQLNKESQHKGLEYLMKAIKVVSGVINVKLIVAGTGNYLQYYRRRVESYKINDRVVFAGYVKDEDLPKYYKESDVVVLPSYNRAEGFGMVLIEAQACSTPVIGTTVGGIPYAVKHGETGLLVPPKDPEALADAIKQILSNEKLAKEMGQRGFERVNKEFTWDKSAEDFLKIVKEVSGK